jgi:hypothetical protein
MTNGQHRRIYPAVCTALLSFIMAPATYAQEEAAPDVHWAYASFFGTGWYKVSNTSEAFVVRASPRWAIGASDIDDRGNRKFGYTLRVPVTFGLTRFELDDIPGLIDFNNLSTLSVGFGADVDIPVNERFSLRPTAEFGFGSVLGESEHAWTWRTELRSRYMFETDKLDWALLAGIGITGYEPNDGESDDFSYASLAAEFAHPIKWRSSENIQTMLYWHLGYMEFIDNIEFASGLAAVDSVTNYWQLGLAMGKREEPVSIWFMKFDRLGLAYKYSDTGRLRGITLVFRSLYDL